MKIIKFKKNKSFSYKRSVIINDLLLNISVGIHKFERKNKQRVKFNLKINTDSSQVPDDSDLSSIINYEEVINIIKKITNRKHYPLLETLAEKILNKKNQNK